MLYLCHAPALSQTHTFRRITLRVSINLQFWYRSINRERHTEFVDLRSDFFLPLLTSHLVKSTGILMLDVIDDYVVWQIVAKHFASVFVLGFARVYFAPFSPSTPFATPRIPKTSSKFRRDVQKRLYLFILTFGLSLLALLPFDL